MASTLEVPDAEKKRLLQTAPPIAETAALESIRGVQPVKDTVSRTIISKSNASVSLLLRDCLKFSLKLSKTVYGNVSRGLEITRVLGGLLR